MGDIVVLKLITSEEIMGRVVEQTDDYLLLHNVRTLMLQQDQKTGAVGMGLMHFMLGCNSLDKTFESDIKIYNSSILAEPVTVPEDLAKAYIQSTTDLVIV